MKRIISTTILAAAAALAGCSQSDQTDTVNEAANETAAAPIVLPPAIAGSHAYRCKDNKLIYIDWYSDGSARVKASRNEVGTQVPPPAPDATEPSPLVGTASDTTITYQGQSCKR
jgi:hypothetical protein